MTAPDSAVFKNPTIFLPASFAVLGCKKIEHRFKIAVDLKYGIIEKRHKSFCVRIEVTQFFFEFLAVSPDIPVFMSKTFSTAQPAGAQRIEYFIVYQDSLLI